MEPSSAPGPAPSLEVEVPLSPCFQKETTDKTVTLATSRAGELLQEQTLCMQIKASRHDSLEEKKTTTKTQLERLAFAEISA